MTWGTRSLAKGPDSSSIGFVIGWTNRKASEVSLYCNFNLYTKDNTYSHKIIVMLTVLSHLQYTAYNHG